MLINLAVTVYQNVMLSLSIQSVCYATLLCAATGTCDTPELPKEAVVTVNGTAEGSWMRVTCRDGEGGAEFVCDKNGLWYLDPAEYGCRDHDIHSGTFVYLNVLVCCSTWYIFFHLL